MKGIWMRTSLFSTLICSVTFTGCVAPKIATGPRHPEGSFERRVYTGFGEAALPYRLLKPVHYAKLKPCPLVLFLHGMGERGADNEKQMQWCVKEFAKAENLKAYPCFVLVPQCPANEQWVDVDLFADAHTMPKNPAKPMRLALGAIQSVMQEFAIDPDRIYIVGMSMGGFGVWDALQRYPAMFAAGVPICGGGDPAGAEILAKIPVWAFHGADDTLVKPQRSRNMIEALKAVGGSPRYTEFAGVGHNAWTPAFADPELFTWLFSQKRAD